jgi:hypothetical protein
MIVTKCEVEEVVVVLIMPARTTKSEVFFVPLKNAVTTLVIPFGALFGQRRRTLCQEDRQDSRTKGNRKR